MEKLIIFFKKYILIFILIFAAGMRLYELDLRDFWYDEAFTGIAVKASFEKMHEIINNDVHPPLYYYLLKVFAYWFNYSVYGIRLLSVIFGILGVAAVYYCALVLMNKKTAVLAAFITAISPFAIQYSKEGRMYSMFACLILVASYFFIQALQKNRIRYYVLWGIFMGLATLTHYISLIYIGIFYLAYLVYFLQTKHKDIKPGSIKLWIKNIINPKFVWGLAAFLLIFSVWLKNFSNHLLQQERSNSLGWIEPANFADIFLNIQIFLFGTPLGEMSSGMAKPNEIILFSNQSIFTIVVMFVTIMVFYFIKKRDYRAFLVMVLSIGFMSSVYFISLLDKHYMVARYLLPATYFMYILLAFFLNQISTRARFAFLSVYLFSLLMIVPVGFSTGWNKFYANLDAYQGKEFYILNSFDYVIAKYYLGSERLILYNIDWPKYNPSYWAAVGHELRRTENFKDLTNNQNALIISNTQLEGIDNKSFNPIGLELVEKYDNILLYKY
ncbi:MAG: hypothetical protein GF332_04620 [Candidatus Moranbacteria bacterium]|nr:hypothetical protein [Candidatus Moranbacteria bacterium]